MTAMGQITEVARDLKPTYITINFVRKQLALVLTLHLEAVEIGTYTCVLCLFCWFHCFLTHILKLCFLPTTGSPRGPDHIAISYFGLIAAAPPFAS